MNHIATKLLTPLIVITYVATASADTAGPTSMLYLTAGDQQHILTVQGSTIKTYSEVHQFEYAIAVSSDMGVQTLGRQPGEMGSQYTLGMSPTGTSYAYPLIANAYDGTTDGSHNYLAGYTDGTIYQTDRNWTNPVALFSTGTSFGTQLGITYDASNNSLWISAFGATWVRDYSMSGTILSSFDTGHFENGALALDPADGTLWLDNRTTIGVHLEGYSQSGVLLHTLNVDTGDNILGGEFVAETAVPLPATAWGGVALLGVLGLLRLRKSRTPVIRAD